MADRGKMDAKLVGAAGVGLKLDPAGAIAGAFDHPIASAGGQAIFLVDMHLLAAGAGLFGQRQVDDAVIDAMARRR